MTRAKKRTKLRVVSIQRPQKVVIETLRELLKDAESGEIQSFVVAAELTERRTMVATAFGEDLDVARIVCALERAKLKMLLAAM